LSLFPFLVIASGNFLGSELPENVRGATILIVILCILVIFSFAIAGTQAAIFSLEDKEVDLLKTKQESSARRILSLLEEPRETFTSMLISKTFINISIIVLSNYLINLYVPEQYLSSTLAIVLKFILIAFLLLFLVEIFPRVWASQNNLRFAYEWSILVMLVEGIHLFLAKISRSIVAIAERVGKGVGADKAEETSIQQFDEAVDVQTDEEVTPEEKNIMKGIVKFGKISVKKVMQSRLYVNGVEYNTSFDDLVRKIAQTHFSRLPVYRENLDHILGVLNTKDILADLYRNDPAYDWRAKIRPVYFVPETKLIEDLLADFQNKRIHFAVVVDEFGGTSGIVTLEDIIEEVIGEVKDEFDKEENLVKQIDENTFIIEGRVVIQDMCKAMKIPSDTFEKVRGASQSVGGLVVELSGELPENGDTVRAGDFEFTVLETEKNRVKMVKVTISPRQATEKTRASLKPSFE
jgi:gliding motility-associated protein GldE